MAIELVARTVLGLGQPPLMMEDPDTEYRLLPSKTYRRFGYRYHVNAYSMRSEDFPAKKADPDELRVMILGDSVINGGAQVPQAELATEILRRDLSRDLGRVVTVGNVAAGSWGPPNLLAYVRKFGLFQADVVVIVLSSHDVDDIPTGQKVVGIEPEFPGQTPWLATEELIGRYILRAIRRKGGASPCAEKPDPAASAQALEALALLIRESRNSGAQVLIAQHLERGEAPGREREGHEAIARVATAEHVPVIQLGPAFARAISEGRNPYRDEIHPTQAGQALLASAL